MKSPELKIIYNPFTVRTISLLNGEPGNTAEIDKLAEGKRLQQWIDRLFMPQLFKDLNTQELDFVFEGTELGVSDVRNAVDGFIVEHGEQFKLNAKYIAHPVQADQKIQQLHDLFDEAQSSPFDEFRSAEMHYAFEKALEPEFDVTVLATMSAGKSTVINAMVGKELLPSKNEACTATIARVINEDSIQEFMVRRLGNEGEVIDDWQTVTEKEQLALVSQWNENELTSVIELKGNIPAIYVRDGIQMVLVDTPGPNNSNDASHRAATVRAINNSQPSMVLYVLNATQLSVKDDRDLLTLIKGAMSKGGREAHERFIFVANKIDTFDSERETVGSVIKNVKKYLETNGIVNPIVIPVSAELTKLIRIKRYYGEDALTRKQKRSLNGLIDQFVEEEEMNLLEQVREDLPRSIYQNLKKQVDEAKAQNNDEKIAELLSGIPIIEAILDAYLVKHAVPARIKDAVDTFSKVAHENQIKQKLNDILSMNELNLKQAIEALDEFNNSKARIEQASEFRIKVKELKYTTSKETKKQRTELDKKVNKLLDSLMDEFSQKLEPTRANAIMTKADRKAKSLIADIQVILTDDLQADLLEKTTALKSDYDQYVQDLLGNFPHSKNMELVKEFQKTSLEMPDVKNLIQNATSEYEKKEFVRTERCGFLWLSKRDIYKTTIEDKVDMSEVGEDFEASLQNIKRVLFVDFEKASISNFELSKESLIEHMESLDSNLNDVLESMRYAQNNLVEKEKMLTENSQKNAWYFAFEKKLAAVIEVGGSK